MNHLAHFFLSGTNKDILLGNFIADFISNKEVHSFSEGIRKGISVHREIDYFTDNHEVVKRSCKRLHAFHHKYSPVVVDVFYDYFLGKNWERYTEGGDKNGISVRTYTQSIYHLLENNSAILPEKLKKRLPYMIQDDWLYRYISVDGQNEAFKRIAKYANFENHFITATEQLIMFEEELNEDFNAFFPDLVSHIHSFIDEL